MKVSLNEAKASQLAEFAKTNLGLDVDYRVGADKIRAMMATAGFTGTEIEVDGPAASEAAPASVAPLGRSGRMVDLEIAEQDIPGGTEPVGVTVNGKLMYIPRGDRVSVPYRYYEVLKNAKMTAYAPAADEFSPVGEKRDVPRFPITVYRIDDPVEEQAA